MKLKKTRYDSKQFHIYLDPETVWEYIETGKDIDELYPEHLKEEVVVEKRNELLKYVLLENEQFGYFCQSDYVITNLGRVYNCLHKRFIAPEVQRHEILCNIRGVKYKFSDLFKQNNWLWDHSIILQNYKQYKWTHNLYFKY